ncbi:hypothetical protein WJX72_001621 [[Myrmecia] bisecta]|uniref:Protein kinase domain-containing protein n=1 Tax=[Myrmecia] bisecta TaxID=41462 RepID=A0AAW1R404_9CHLO
MPTKGDSLYVFTKQTANHEGQFIALDVLPTSFALPGNPLCMLTGPARRQRLTAQELLKSMGAQPPSAGRRSSRHRADFELIRLVATEALSTEFKTLAVLEGKRREVAEALENWAAFLRRNRLTADANLADLLQEMDVQHGQMEANDTACLVLLRAALAQLKDYMELHNLEDGILSTGFVTLAPRKDRPGVLQISNPISSRASEPFSVAEVVFCQSVHAGRLLRQPPSVEPSDSLGTSGVQQSEGPGHAAADEGRVGNRRARDTLSADGSCDAAGDGGQQADQRSSHKQPKQRLTDAEVAAERGAVDADALPDGARPVMPVFPGREFALEELNIQEVIASDTVGVVVRGRLGGVDVAIKAVNIAQEEELHELRHELEAYRTRLSALHDKTIPRLVAFGTTHDGQVAFLATALVVGGPLEPLQLDEPTMAQRLSSLPGPVKLRNIMREAATERIVILDFSSSNLEAKAWELASEKRIIRNRMRTELEDARRKAFPSERV